MAAFIHSYKVSLLALGIFSIAATLLSLSNGVAGFAPGIFFLLLLGTSMIPVLRKGGISGHPRLALAISSGIAAIFGGLVSVGFAGFILTRGGEGPRGEGSPLAVIVALTFFALCFFCPWLLTALRGFAALRESAKARKAVTADGPGNFPP